MDRLLIVLLICCLPIVGNAQSFSERRKADRERWYKEKEYADRQNNNAGQNDNPLADIVSAEALKAGKFVFEADRLISKYGSNVYVNSNTNFVLLNGREAVVQISPMNAYPGFNGVGGITLDGHASDVKVTEDKKGKLRLSMNVSGAAISARIDITYVPGSENAYLTISPNFNSNRLDLIGKIVPIENSDVFKGSSI